MEVVVNGALAKAGDGASYLPYVRDSEGKVRELARLNDPSKLRRALTGAVTWDVASLVVAQKHLADISTKLDDIKESVDRIAAYQQDERKAKITAAARHLFELVRAMFKGEPPDRQTIERYAGSLAQVQEHLKFELERETSRIEELERKELFGTGDFYDAITSRQDILSGLLEQWCCCLRVRILAWQLLAAFEEPRLWEVRRESIESDLDATQGLLEQIGASLKRKSDAMVSIYNRRTTIDQRKAKINERILSCRQTVDARQIAAREEIHIGERLAAARQGPLRLAVRVHGNEIVEAFDLDNPLT